MNSPNNGQPLPTSYADAIERLRRETGGSLNYRSMSYVLKGVRVLHVAERLRAQRVKNPARERSLWGWLTADEYVWTNVRDLGELFADGKSVGRVHGGSEDHARGLMPLFAMGPQDIVIQGHFTESGWYVDSVALAN